MNKIKIALGLLTIIAGILTFSFPMSHAFLWFMLFGASLIFYIIFDILSSFDKETDAQYLVRVLKEEIQKSPKVKNKLNKLSDQEQQTLAQQFVREIGSDTQCIKLKMLKK